MSSKEKKDSSKKRPNPRAFAASNIVSAERSFRKRADISQKRVQLPSVKVVGDVDPPPIVVAIAGPPRVGKSTLLRCLLKQFSNMPLTKILGPVTVVANKHRRLTFIECPNDIFSMIDIVKCADLVLLMIDASFGFQMEIFEFLSICQAHGFPRIMGVLNHLDCISSVEKRRKTRKLLKARFWTEVYKGSKMFYLTRILEDGLYVRQEIHNLSRFISVIKFNKTTGWRSSHPYMLVDRIERIPDWKALGDDASLVGLHLFGYLRGFNLRDQSKVHIVGCGDFDVSQIQKCSDPCRLPEQEDASKRRRRSLRHIERGVYGHFSGFGGILYDEETVAIDLAGSHFGKTDQQQQQSELPTLGKVIQEPPNVVEEIEEDSVNIRVLDSDVSDEDGEDVEDSDEFEMVEAGEDSSNEIEFDEKEDYLSNNIFMLNQTEKDWKSLVYTNDESAIGDDGSGEELAGLFRVKQKSRVDADDFHHKSLVKECSTEIDQLIPLLKNCFVTGKWDEETDAEALLNAQNQIVEDQTDTYQNHPAEALKPHQADEETPFMKEMNEKVSRQTETNAAFLESLNETERFAVEGYRVGAYLRLRIENVPVEFLNNFDPNYPLLVGGLNAMEAGFGVSHVRLRKHRWHKKILKCRDPVIVSLGWRKFQVTPVLFGQDHNMRNRFLKYTPEHSYCHAAFHSPTHPKNVGCVFIVDTSPTSQNFRIAGLGVTLGCDKSLKIVKKLKLTGEPYQVFKKTAFVKNMFHSQLEVAKFEGAALKTVSGIRGQLKKALTTPEGAFRATFEDKLKLSDIVFLRAWVPVPIPKYYDIVKNMLLPAESKHLWSRMRTLGQIKRDLGIKFEPKPNSTYRSIDERPQERFFTPLKIPLDLQKSLPFKVKSRVVPGVEDVLEAARPAVVRELKEAEILNYARKLKILHKKRMQYREEKKKIHAKERERELAKIEERKERNKPKKWYSDNPINKTSTKKGPKPRVNKRKK